MSQAGYTPIQLYFSTTAAAVPVNTNLANGELAINITDGKLYYKDNGGTVRLLASNATSAPVLSFQTSLSGLTPSTATTGVVTLAGTLGTSSGGTNLTSFTSGGVVYASSTSALATGSALTFNGSALAVTGTISATGNATFSGGTATVNNLVNTVGQAATLNLTTFNTNFGSSNTLQLLTTLNNATTGASTSTFKQFNHNQGSEDVFITKTSGDAGYLAISTGTGAAEVARFTSTGLGLGSTNPTFKLVVQGTANTTSSEILVTATSVASGYLGSNANGFNIGTDTAGLIFKTGVAGSVGATGTERMRITSAGDVGIGTSSPSGKLHVVGAVDTSVTLGDSTVGDYAFIKALSYPAAADGYTIFDLQAYSSLVSSNVMVGGYGFSKEGSGTDNKAYYALSTHNGTSLGERLRITSAGTLTLKNDYQEQTYTANSSTAITLNITTNGTDQVITLTGTATITMPTAVAGKSFLLKLKTGAGGYTVTWSTVKWPSGTAPTLTSTASRMDIFSFFSDGTNWYGCTVGANYTP